MQLIQEQDKWIQLTADVTVRGPPSPCFQTVLTLLPAPARGWGGCTHMMGLWAWATKATQVWERAPVWPSPRNRLCVSSVPPLIIGARSELTTLTQQLSSWPVRPLGADCLGAGGRCLCVCWAVCVHFLVAASFSTAAPFSTTSPRPGAPGSLGGGFSEMET